MALCRPKLMERYFREESSNVSNIYAFGCCGEGRVKRPKKCRLGVSIFSVQRGSLTVLLFSEKNVEGLQIQTFEFLTSSVFCSWRGLCCSVLFSSPLFSAFISRMYSQACCKNGEWTMNFHLC